MTKWKLCVRFAERYKIYKYCNRKMYREKADFLIVFRFKFCSKDWTFLVISIVGTQKAKQL